MVEIVLILFVIFSIFIFFIIKDLKNSFHLINSMKAAIDELKSNVRGLNDENFILNEDIKEYKNKIIEFNQDNAILQSEINKLFAFCDVLRSSLNEPMYTIFNELNELPLDKVPKNEKEMKMFIEYISNKNFEKLVERLNEKIKNETNVETKQLIELKLQKLHETKLLLQTLDENSSDEYTNIIKQNVSILMNEINQIAYNLFEEDDD